ncbi:MAG: N-acetyl-gamma-glutamyl-phosphate reductase [Mycobacteriales bacterium]
MGTTVAVAGASGYAGGELLRLLAAHPDLQIGPVTGHGTAGQRLGEVHPHLPALAGRVLEDTAPGVLAGADLVFLALPHGASARVAAALPSDTPIVDLGADFRLADGDAWRRHYGPDHPGHWPYGLPELNRAALAGATRIANPGCYPTAASLALAPLLAAGLVDPDDLVVVAASGTSGAGRAARPHLLGSEVMGDLAAYRVGEHQHAPEIAQTLTAAAGRPVTLSFTPVLAPLPRGILATATAVLNPGTTAAQLRDVLHAAYDPEPFVHVLPEGAWPHTAATVGSNACHLQVTADGGRAVVVAALDNLGKGAAGQAVQNANLVLGLDETAGLTANGVAP